MPIELRSLRKGLINVKNNDQKCFLWCHVRHINPVKEHPGRIKKIDKRLTSNLNYDEIEFPVQEKYFSKIEKMKIKKIKKIKNGFVKVVYNVLMVKIF